MRAGEEPETLRVQLGLRTVDRVLIAVWIFASNDLQTNMLEFIYFLDFSIYSLFIKCFVEIAEQLATYLYIILDLNIFYLNILCIF